MRAGLPVWLCRFFKINLILLLTILPGCAGESDGPPIEEPAIDWDSPRMREIKVEWISLHDAYSRQPRLSMNEMIRYSELVHSVDRLFQRRLPPSRLPELAASSKMPALNVDGFTEEILAFIIKALIQSGDRESLVELLSKRCPSLINMAETIEYYLAYHGWRFEDRMHIFAEAYERSQVPETRHALVTAVRRNFVGLGIRGENEAEFLDHAMQWYEREKGRLFVNREYFLNEIAERGITTYDFYEKYPDLYDNPPPSHEPLFMVVAPGAVGNLGEDPDR